MADNQEQQREQDVVVYSAFAGLRNDIAPYRFGPGDLVSADNVDIDRSGLLSRRAGYTRQRTGATHSLWADEQGTQCLLVTGGVLNQMNPDYSLTALATLTDAAARVSFTKVNDRVYYSNGVDVGVVEDGAARSWGLPVPPLPAVSTTVGYLTAGTYQFVATYLRADGQESGAGLAGQIDVLDGSGLVFTLPPAVAGVEAVALYLSPPNEPVLYQAGAGLPGDTLTCTGLGVNSLPLTTQFLGPAPAGQLTAYYRGRLYVAVGDVLFASSPFGYELFDLREYVQLDGRITLLAPMTDKEMSDTSKNSGFFIGTDRSCGVLVGSGPQDFQYVPKSSYGAIEGAMDYVDGSLFGDDSAGMRELPMWLTTQGLCVGLPNLEVRNLTRTKYGFAAAGSGAALFMPGPNRFIATSNL